MTLTLVRLPSPSVRNQLPSAANPPARIRGRTFTGNARPNCFSVLHTENKLLHPAAAASVTPEYPTMSDIMESSRARNVRLRLQAIGPFFRVSAVRWDDERQDLGAAEGVIRPWVGGNVLHLDSMRMNRATLSMDRGIFGLGLFLGAAAVRHGYDCGCARAELLAIYDTDEYHTKLVKFYTRMGFRAVREVEGMTMGDLPHMLVWGGKGTRMDANIRDLMIKWGKKFRPPRPATMTTTATSPS